MGDTGESADKTGSATTKKTNDPVETPRASDADKPLAPLDSTSGQDSQLTPIAQIAVDNQTNKLPGTVEPEKDVVDGQGNLKIKPLDGTQAVILPEPRAVLEGNPEPQAKKLGQNEPVGGTETKVEVPAKQETETKAETPVQAEVLTRSAELAQLPVVGYRDGLSDAIDLTVRHVAQLPTDDKARQLVVRDLAEKFDNPKSYAEKLQAAKALIFLTRGQDGQVPETVAMRDVAIAEKGKTVGRGNQAKYVVEVEAHHEFKPLKGRDVLNFINNSAETLENQVKDLKDKPQDDKDRHNLQQKLTMIFQTYGEDTPEKLAAAKGLLDLNRKSDGTYPEILGTRTIEHAKVTKPGFRGQGVVTVSEARTEQKDTSKTDVERFLGRHSETLTTDTAKIVELRERNTKQPPETPAGSDAPDLKASAAQDAVARRDLYNRSVFIFLDSKVPEDKTAAAVALLELKTGSDGTIGDNLGHRNVHVDAVTKPGFRNAPPTIVTPARDYVESISKDDALKYLQTQLETSAPPRGRIMAADALKSAGVIDETRYKEVVSGILSDERAPETLKAQLRKSSGVEQQQEALKLGSDGRVIGAKPEDYLTIPNESGQRERLQVTLERLALNPKLKELVSEKQIEEMKRELNEGTFGPASRDFYNKAALHLNALTTSLAVEITSRNGKLPEGSPISVPKDNSGRAVGDEYFRAQLLTGALKMDLKTLKAGELPDGDRLKATALWDVKAGKELDDMHLKWEASVFDDRLKVFNKNGKLDAWMSNDNMSIDQLRELQSARGEWLQLGIQVRNYAHGIHYFNKATTEASNIPRYFSGVDLAKFSDEALNDENFPGKVVRENGKIKSIEIDMPETLDRTDPTNMEKISKLRAWLEKYGPQVDQVTDEVRQASINSGRLLMWGDTPDEGIDPVTKKPYNLISMRFEAETVKVKMPDGTEEERIKVTSRKQKQYAGALSYQGWGDVSDVGNPETSGEIKVNGKVIPVNSGKDGVSLGTKGDIKVTGDSVDPNHASMRVADDGRTFIRDNGSKSGTYVGGQKIESGKWVEVFPDQLVSLGKPAVALQFGKNENGEDTFNGQTLKVGEPTKIGTNSSIKVEGEGISAEHSLVKVEADGRIFIKDNGSEKGTYVNGKPISSKDWTQISATDRVTFGPPEASLDIEGDVRFYKPGDMVTVLLDGQMQLMPAENLQAWANEAANWQTAGKLGMLALDLGMIATGTIELKALQVAAKQGLKEVGKAGARAAFREMVHSPGFTKAIWHMGLGATGILHQSIENTGPAGKHFMHLRGYAMMLDVFHGSVVKDGVALTRKAFGMTKPLEKGTALSEYLAVTPWAKRVSGVTEKMFLGMNGYFIADIGANQVPGIVANARGLDTGKLLIAGQQLRAGQFDSGSDDIVPKPATLEDKARRFASPEAQEKITKAKQEAAEIAKLPEEKKQEKQAYLAKLTGQFLDSTNPDDKLAAAFGLLNYHAQSGEELPDVLGTRYKTQNDLPENATETNVIGFINTRIPRSINMFDKQLQTAVESRFADVAKVSEQPQDSADRKQLNDRLLNEFNSGKDENQRVAAAMGLMLLNEQGGKVPDKLGTVIGDNGEEKEVTAQDLRAVLEGYQSKALIARFDSYVSSMKGNESLNAVLGKTRDLIVNADNAAERKAESTRLQAVFENSTNKEEKAAAALGLIFLNADKSTGAFPETLAQTTYQVDVQQWVDTGGEFGGYIETVKEDRIRDLKSADVLQYLKGNMPTFSVGTRLAMADLMYRADEPPLAGHSKVNDYGGLLLQIVGDKNATPQERKEALVNAHGLGLAEAMAIHRFSTEPGITAATRTATEADLYGRDSKAMQKVLLDIISQPNEDRDLRALASATLLANSETDPAKRKALLTQMQTDYDRAKGTPGAYYQQVFERESAIVKSLVDTQPTGEDVSRMFRSALLMSQTNSWKEFGITDAQMAKAFETAFDPASSQLLALQALEPMLKHYKDLDDESKDWVSFNLNSLIKDNQGEVGTPGYLLKHDVIDRIEKINETLGPKFAAESHDSLIKILTTGDTANLVSDEETRAKAVRALARTTSNDLATQDLLKRLVGATSEPGDKSALARSAAFDRLSELKPAGFNQLAAKLLETETDPEVLRKIGEIERSTRRIDPDSQEYREQFRQSLKKLMEAGVNKYSLAEVPDFVRKNYPMLEWDHMFKDAVTKGYEDVGDWRWRWQNVEDLYKPYLEEGKKEASRQLDAIIAKAAHPEGDMERRTLAWIVMSNGRFSDESTKKDAVLRAANGLLNASRGDATTKAQLAPLLTMAIATQDRMPFEARNTLVTALENLAPGTPGSPISKEDAGVALLAGLKRQFERTPKDAKDPNYKAAHELQMHLIEVYSKYASPESIPIMEAIAGERSKVALARDPEQRIKDVNYPDKSIRSVAYDQNNQVWQLTSERNGATQVLVRNGISDEWYDQADTTKKTVWRGKVAVDQSTGAIQMADSYGKSTTYTADGATIYRNADKVEKVTYPDGSSREFTSPTREVITFANGSREVWTAKNNVWTVDVNPTKRGSWTGTIGFDEHGNFVQVSGAEKKIIRPDGSTISYSGDKPVLSTSSASDDSAHGMPLVRERAKQLLDELRDGTDVLIGKLKLDTQSTPQQLADNLRKVANGSDKNSADITSAVLVAGLSKPITEASDPRRAVLRDLLNDPHERISMAAAKVLFRSAEQEDRKLAAAVIADIAKNGSKKGFRDDANRLIAEVKQKSATTDNGASADAKLLETALQNTKSAPRIDTGRFEAPHTIDEQEKYEQATGALIRDNQITMDALENPEWWKQHGYQLLESGAYLSAAFKSTEVDLGFFEKIGAFFDQTNARQKASDQFDRLNSQRDEQMKLLTDRALSLDESQESIDARNALALIVLSNGYPVLPSFRARTVDEAANTLARIYTRGGPGAAFAERVLNDTLVANPGINLGVRSTFAHAVIKRQGLDESVKGNASAPKAALLLANALDSEAWAMPMPDQPGYKESIDFQSMIMMRLDRMGETISMPVLEAIAKGHPDADLRRRAGETFDKLKDGTSYILERTLPDTTTDKAVLAKSIKELVEKPDNAKNEEELVTELVRMAHPRTFDSETGSNDPRVEALRTALNHPNDRVRLVAASTLTRVGDPRGMVALSQLQDSSRSGIRREANLDYEGTFMMRFMIAKLTPETESFARKTMTDENADDRARIATARLILVEHPNDAGATEVLVKMHASKGDKVNVEAEEAIKEIIRRNPIQTADDPRRAVLEKQLQSNDAKTQLSAAWLLSRSSVQGDLEKAVTTLGRLAVNTEAKSQAQTLLKEVIAYGSDSQHAFALKQWNDAWIAKGSPTVDKPAVPSDLEQARKYFRTADAFQRSKIFSLPDAEKKALIMHLSGKSEAELEMILQPAPTADLYSQQTTFNPFDAFKDRGDLLFPLPGTDQWSGNNYGLNRPLATRWQASSNDRWSQRVPTVGNTGLDNLNGTGAQPYYRATTGGVPSYNGGGVKPLGTTGFINGGKIRVDAENATSFLNINRDNNGQFTPKDSTTLARLSVANLLQEKAGTGSVIQIGRDGKFSVQTEGDVSPDGSGKKWRLAHTSIDGGKALTLDGSTETPKEFSEFLEYLSKQRPDIMNQPTIKSSELSVMFLQYLRQREAGLTTGFVVTPSLFDSNVELLTSDRSVMPWYSRSGNRDSANQTRMWTEVQKERERYRAGKLDGELAKLLAPVDSNGKPIVDYSYNGPGAHWQPTGKVEVREPDLLARPPVEQLEVNRYGLTDILPVELLSGGRPVIQLDLTRTSDNTTIIAPRDVAIPTAMLNPDLWRAKQLISSDRVDRLQLVKSPGNTTRVTTDFSLSPASQEILRRYRQVRLQEQVNYLNNWTAR